MSGLKGRTPLQGLRILTAPVRQSGSALVMCQLGRFKDGGLIAAILRPNGIDDAHPPVGQRPHRHAVTFAFSPFALLVAQRPALPLSRQPGKLVEGIAERLDTGVALVRLGVIPTGKSDRRCPRQGLYTRTSRITGALITPLRQQSRCQPFAGTRKPTEESAVSVGQKKALDLL